MCWRLLVPLRETFLAVVVLVSLFGAGCRSLGPRTIPKDRADYSEAIAKSWMRQTLLNIVKLRYHTAPVFVDVAAIGVRIVEGEGNRQTVLLALRDRNLSAETAEQVRELRRLLRWHADTGTPQNLPMVAIPAQ